MRRVYFYTVLVALFTCTPAFAGVMAIVKTITAAPTLWIGAATVLLVFVINRITPDKWIQAVIGKPCYAVGKSLSFAMNTSRWTKPFWEAIVEPFLIQLIRNTVQTAADQFIAGAESDNEK